MFIQGSLGEMGPHSSVANSRRCDLGFVSREHLAHEVS